jgi:putative RecB family exonuclease
LPVYSHSRLETFENCPMMYKLRYIDRIRSEEEGIEAFMGSEVHAALEKLYKDVRMSKQDSLEDILTFYKDSWEKDWHDKVTIVKKGLTSENYFDMGRKCISRYYERFAPFDQGVPVWIEENVSFELSGFKMAVVVDRMDRMRDGSFEIHDYKTGGRLPAQKDMDESRQLALYEMAVRGMWKDTGKVKLVWHFLQFGVDLVCLMSREKLGKVEADCVSLINDIEGCKDFAPKPSALCDWFGYWEYCPARKHHAKIAAMAPAMAAKEDGFALVNEYSRLKEEERKATEAAEAVRLRLIEYSRRENVSWIQGGSRAASVRVQTILGFPAKYTDPAKYGEVEQISRQAGLWDDFAMLDLKGLLEAVSEGKLDADVAKRLGAMIQEKKITIVKLQRRKDEVD